MPGTARQLVFGQPRDPCRKHHRVRLDRQARSPPTRSRRARPGRPIALRRGKLGRDAEADDAGDILGAGAPAPLLAAALDQGLDGHPSRSTRAPTPLGPPILCAERVIMSAPSALKSSLILPPPEPHRYAEDRRPHGRSRASRDRLDRAGFVVGRHQRNEGPPPSEMVFLKLFLKHARSITPSPRREFVVVLSR